LTPHCGDSWYRVFVAIFTVSLTLTTCTPFFTLKYSDERDAAAQNEYAERLQERDYQLDSLKGQVCFGADSLCYVLTVVIFFAYNKYFDIRQTRLTTKQVNNLKETLSLIEGKHAELGVRFNAEHSRCIKMMMRLRTAAETKREARHYKTLLLSVSVAGYMRAFRLRKRLFRLHHGLAAVLTAAEANAHIPSDVRVRLQVRYSVFLSVFSFFLCVPFGKRAHPKRRTSETTGESDSGCYVLTECVCLFCVVFVRVS
jgi:hypothetical protein